MIRIWRDLDPRHGWEQMALDRALLDLTADTRTIVLRLYRWQANTISFGANESALRHWNRAAIEQEGIALVRRPSGGRAVWHAAEDLTYSLTAPLSYFGGQQQAYQIIHEKMAAALESTGSHANLAAPPARLPGLQMGSCFDVAVGGEVLLDGRKAVGSAQLVIGKHLLQHGEIARTERHGALARFAQGGETIFDTSHSLELPSAELLADSIAATWYADGAEPADDELIAAANTAALELHAHFRDPQWTWRR